MVRQTADVRQRQLSRARGGQRMPAARRVGPIARLPAVRYHSALGGIQFREDLRRVLELRARREHDGVRGEQTPALPGAIGVPRCDEMKWTLGPLISVVENKGTSRGASQIVAGDEEVKGRSRGNDRVRRQSAERLAS